MNHKAHKSFKYTTVQLILIYGCAVVLGASITYFFTSPKDNSIFSVMSIMGIAFSTVISVISGKSIYEMIRISK